MTNSEIKKYFEEATIDYAHGVENALKAEGVVKCVLNLLEENDRLKAEIDRIKNESHRRSDMLLQEIKQLEAELEQSDSCNGCKHDFDRNEYYCDGCKRISVDNFELKGKV